MDVHQQETAPVGEQRSMRGTVASVSCNDVYSFSKPVREEIVLIAGLGVAGDVHAGLTVRHRSRVAVDPDQPNLRQVHLIRAELHDEVNQAGYDVPAGGLGENVTTTGIDLLALPVGTVLRFGPTPAPGAERSPAVEADLAGPPDGAAAVVAVAARATLDAPSAEAVAALAARIQAEQTAEKTAGPITEPDPADHDNGHTGADGAPDPRPAIVITGLRNPCQQINNYRPGLLKRVLGREPDGTLSRRAGVMAVVLRGGPVRPGAEIHVELPPGPHRPLDRV
ncbi:MOSC domain-containing protein [Actinoplanes sp. NPDC048791]|uniref:MOSC domain-containing protein n=1 Tax=Actinoplanes sp. NPDC048791 TaxID=3154623 RepID=UPI00340DD10F